MSRGTSTLRAARCRLPAVLLMAALGCDPQVVVGYAPDAEAPPAQAPVRPEVSWLSGAHAGHEPQALMDFETWRGRRLDLALFFVDRTVGWPGLVTPRWPVDMLAEVEARLVLAEPLYPEGEGNNQDCAAGAYDEQWRKLGPFLAERGRGDSIIRLGWGPNDSEHDWRADADPADWIACYRRVVEAIASGGPELQFSWEFNHAGGPEVTALDPYLAYPGDDYVDFVGIEAFDRHPPTLTAAEWERKCNAPTGLCDVIEFARAHDKLLGLSEWGVVSCDARGMAGGMNGGGDNPFFIEQMVRTFAANADVMGFELYYENRTDPCSTLAGGGQNPRAAELYRALYRAE